MRRLRRMPTGAKAGLWSAAAGGHFIPSPLGAEGRGGGAAAFIDWANEVAYDDLGPLRLLGSPHSRRGTRPMGRNALQILEGSGALLWIPSLPVANGQAASVVWIAQFFNSVPCFSPSERTITAIKSTSFTAIFHCKGLFEMHCLNAAML
jgi:hypothetical protein